jgi:hypothetical protein
MNAPYPPPAAAPGRDRTTLWGVLGLIVGFFCCGILGIIFGALSLRDARRFNNSPLLGWLAIALSIVNIVVSGILRVSGRYPYWD